MSIGGPEMGRQPTRQGEAALVLVPAGGSNPDACQPSCDAEIARSDFLRNWAPYPEHMEKK